MPTPRWQQLVPLEDEARQLSKIFSTILIKVRKRYAKEKEERRKLRTKKTLGGGEKYNVGT
jgi:hypothetical protein